MENYHFSELQNNPELFFNILPPDWKSEIFPFWENYENQAKIYIIKQSDEITGGGIVFSIPPPHFDYFKEEAKFWFDKQYHYLGFIFILPEHRNKNLGSFWLQELKLKNPRQNYFLLTEEPHLQRFYEKNDFKCLKTFAVEDHLEWLFIYNESSS